MRKWINEEEKRVEEKWKKDGKEWENKQANNKKKSMKKDQ